MLPVSGFETALSLVVSGGASCKCQVPLPLFPHQATCRLDNIGDEKKRIMLFWEFRGENFVFVRDKRTGRRDLAGKVAERDSIGRIIFSSFPIPAKCE